MTSSPPRLANILLVALMALAICGAWLLQNSGILSLTPPPSIANAMPEPDAVGREFALYLSAFTAWAGLFLLMPAYVFVWCRRGSAVARDWWLAFWGVAFAAYLIHLIVSMVMFFGGDFSAMTSTSRVSAFWPGMLILLWWPLDLLLARRPETAWITMQRVALHVAVFALFVGGSAVMGELVVAKVIGLALFALVLVSFGRWAKRRLGAA